MHSLQLFFAFRTQVGFVRYPRGEQISAKRFAHITCCYTSSCESEGSAAWRLHRGDLRPPQQATKAPTGRLLFWRPLPFSGTVSHFYYNHHRSHHDPVPHFSPIVLLSRPPYNPMLVRRHSSPSSPLADNHYLRWSRDQRAPESGSGPSLTATLFSTLFPRESSLSSRVASASRSEERFTLAVSLSGRSGHPQSTWLGYVFRRLISPFQAETDVVSAGRLGALDGLQTLGGQPPNEGERSDKTPDAPTYLSCHTRISCSTKKSFRRWAMLPFLLQCEYIQCAQVVRCC